MNSQPSKSKLLWNKLFGDADEFSMENRAFNIVSVFSFFLLIVSLGLEIYFSPTIMMYVIIILIFVQVGVYYFSRYKRKYNSMVVVYGICSYIALIINFYANAGIDGSALCFFFITLNFLIAFSKSRLHLLWLCIHLLVMLFLITSEYYHPEWSLEKYDDRKIRFVDIAWGNTIAIIFIFSITHFLRRYFNNERALSEERADAITEQNTQIAAQNRVLEKVNEEKDILFSIISHDLKSPLDAITAYLELLSQTNITNEEKAALETELLERTKYTSDLLSNLLSWAKAQMHGIKVHLAPLHLKEIIEDVTNNKMTFAEKKGIRLTHSIDPSIDVICDKEMLHIILRNLVNNAIKFTQPGGEIFIKVSKKGDAAEISVRDTGIGMSVEKQEDIFTMKMRSTFGTNNEKGIGLGLIMCKQFMEYQNGSIRFESEIGKGSVFYLSLPLARISTGG